MSERMNEWRAYRNRSAALATLGEPLETSPDPPALQGQKSQLPAAADSSVLVSGPSPASLRRSSGVAQVSMQSEPSGQFEASFAG